MKVHMRDVVEKVRRDRVLGLSLRQLETKYGISNTRISVWVKDIVVKNKLHVRARASEKNEKELFNSVSGSLQVTEEIAKLLSSLLYWCEGSKYPSSNCVALTNSDPILVQTFISLLRKGFKIDESKFRVTLQVHTSHDYQVVRDYWSMLLNISKEKFYKPTITNPTLKRKRMNYVGTCTVKYYDVKILFNLMGIYESFGKISIRRGG